MANLTELRGKIKHYRERSGLSQEQLAHLSGIDPTDLSRKLRGSQKSKLNRRELIALIKALFEARSFTSQTQVQELLKLGDFTSLSTLELSNLQLDTLPKGQTIETLPVTARLQPDLEILYRQDYSSYIEAKTRHFVGREFVFDRVNRFLNEVENTCGYFFISGDPGIGKTALIAQLVKTHHYPHHFNIRSYGRNTYASFVRNLLAQLAAKADIDPQVWPSLVENIGALDILFQRISARLARHEKVVIVIDALNEAEEIVGSSNPLRLPSVLPTGIYIITTMHRETTSKLALDSTFDYYELRQDDPLNQADVRAYLSWAATLPGVQTYIRGQSITEAEFIDYLTAKSQGNFIYLEYVCRDIEKGLYNDLKLKFLPLGLQQYYQKNWDRIKLLSGAAWNQERLPVILALVIAERPITVETIVDFSGVDEAQALEAISDWISFLYREKVSYGDETLDCYRIYHDSFQTFIAEKLGARRLRQARQKMIEMLDSYLS